MSETQTKKSLGQHWLHDEESLEAMCDAAHVGRDDLVLEIGPGLGTLTEHLLKRGAEVWAFEVDKTLIPGLEKKFGSYDSSKFFVSNTDILSYDFSLASPGYKIVANIPYYLTSHLLRKITEAPNHFSEAALLVQKEVAERVCAAPGQMSLLSVSVQLYCDVSVGKTVPAALFTPAPKVDSQILILRHLGQPRFEVEADRFFRLVKAGFSERRKKLRSSLSGGLHIPKHDAEQLLINAGIDPNMRAQALSLADWHRLYQKSQES